MKKIPFVGLHAHSVAGSIFDALGYPQEHMDFAFENGMDALALTDHGNMNGLPHQVLHAKKMKEAGKDFKPIFGIFNVLSGGFCRFALDDSRECLVHCAIIWFPGKRPVKEFAKHYAQK